jgi:hypothetical protein
LLETEVQSLLLEIPQAHLEFLSAQLANFANLDLGHRSGVWLKEMTLAA